MTHGQCQQPSSSKLPAGLHSCSCVRLTGGLTDTLLLLSFGKEGNWEQGKFEPNSRTQANLTNAWNQWVVTLQVHLVTELYGYTVATLCFSYTN